MTVCYFIYDNKVTILIEYFGCTNPLRTKLASPQRSRYYPYIHWRMYCLNDAILPVFDFNRETAFFGQKDVGMKNLGLQARFALFGFAPLVVALLMGAVGLSVNESRRLEAEVRAKSEATVEGIVQLLQMSDSLMGQQTHSAMKLFQEKSRQSGPPGAADAVGVGNSRPNNLHFGSRLMALDTALVDNVSAIAGGSATLFARGGKP